MTDVFQNVEYKAPASPTDMSVLASQALGSLGQLAELQIGAGANSFKVDRSGGWAGANFFDDGPFSFDMLGNVIVNSIVINGLSGATLAGAIDANGNFVNQLLSNNFNTATKQILGEFVFYGSGALAIKTDASNGIWLSPTGILAKSGGNTTFSLDSTGSANFAGTVTGVSGTFGTITAGTFTGCVFQTGTSGYRTVIDTNNIRFYSDNTLKGFFRPDSGKSIVIGSADDFYFTDINGTPIFKMNSNGNFDITGGASIAWSSGRTLKDASSEIQVNGDFRVDGACYPRLDNSDYFDLGKSSKRWKTVWSKYLNTGDIVFSDQFCPICNQEFQEGDNLVLFLHKKDISGPAPQFYTVPAHVDCVKNYKKSNHAVIQAAIIERSDSHEAIIKVSEKKFDKDFEKNQKIALSKNNL